MPAQQQSGACPCRQLPKTPLLREHDHAVERQHHGEQVDRSLGGDHVAVIQRGKRREAEQGCRESDLRIGGEAEQRQVRRHGRRDEERHHQDPRGAHLRVKIVGKRRQRGLDDQVAANGKAVVRLVARFSVAAEVLAPEAEKVVIGRQVGGNGQVVRGSCVVQPGTVEGASVVAYEHRRQRHQQHRERNPFRAQHRAQRQYLIRCVHRAPCPASGARARDGRARGEGGRRCRRWVRARATASGQSGASR